MECVVNLCPRGRVSAYADLFSRSPSVTIKSTDIKVSKLKIDAALKEELEIACEGMKGNHKDIVDRYHVKMKDRAEAARMKADEVNAIIKGIQDTACNLQKEVKNGAPPPPPPMPSDAQLTACSISSTWNLASKNNEAETVIISRTKQQIIESIKNSAANSNKVKVNLTLPEDFLGQLKQKLREKNQKLSAE